ncbi:MAG: hypothetical protein VXX04_01865, partial [Actinomycetota bacterium]|nr:hypothetical protein [Actinomycetota bacterium]
MLGVHDLHHVMLVDDQPFESVEHLGTPVVLDVKQSQRVEYIGEVPEDLQHTPHALRYEGGRA